MLSADIVVDRHLDPFPVILSSFPGTAGSLLQIVEHRENREQGSSFSAPSGEKQSRRGIFWLQTSPEFAMKRLLAAGASAIYQICHVFRAGERGPLHNPEFTLVEWYHVGQGLREGMVCLAELCQQVLGTPEAEQVSYRDVFQTFTGIDPHRATAGQMAMVADLHGVPTPELPEDDLDSWRDILFSELVQPHLGWQRPTIVYGYPASQAALARILPGDPPVAARFELFIRGLELANGYDELTDADELRQRFQQNNWWRVRDGKEALPETSRLEQAMRQAGLPPCYGCALGFDRLVMLAIGAQAIDEVIAFPLERA